MSRNAMWAAYFALETDPERREEMAQKFGQDGRVIRRGIIAVATAWIAIASLIVYMWPPG